MRLVRVPRRMSMASLVHLLAASEGDRFILAVPRRARAFCDALDLELLKLYAREHALQLILVAPDRRIRRAAAMAGLRACSRMPTEYEPDGTRDEVAVGNEQTAARPVRAPLLLLGVMALAIILGAALLLWPRPTVVVTASRRRLHLEARASVSPDYRQSRIEAGRLTARLLARTDLVAVEVASTGSKTVGAAPARGKVKLLNDGNEQLAAPAGTILQSTNGLRFRMQTPAVVPPARHGTLLGVRISTISGQAETEIVAAQPGTQGNLGAGKITSILGPLGRVLRVVNAAGLRGGTDRRVAVVIEEDLARARAEATRQMELKAPDELQALAGTDYILLPETIAVAPGRPSASPGAGEIGAVARVTLPFSARCLAISRATLAEFLTAQARQRVPTHFMVAREPMSVQRLTAKPKRPEEAEVTIDAAYIALGRLERDRILAALCGHSEAEARVALLSLPEVASAQLDLAAGRRFPRYSWLIRLVLPRQDGY